MTDDPVVVVGAGLAGLAAAGELERLGREVVVVEASDGPGGRVRTDLVDGYRLDRGFQILLTAYPMVGRLLDLDALALRSFLPGAMVRLPDGGTATVGDPLRRPRDLVATARAPIGSIADKARVLAFRRAVGRGSLDELWARPDTTARERLEEAGFSARMIERFFQPLFAGITLDDDLAGSSRVLGFVFRMLGAGVAAVPATGMGAISGQLAERVLGPVHYATAARAVAAHGVTLASGDRVPASAVIVATDVSSAAELIGVVDHGWRGVTTVWLAADRAPVDEARIVLNGTGAGPITNLAVMSAVSEAYAPPGGHLVAVSGSGVGATVADGLRAQLGDWYPEAASWTVLRVDQIDRAQPVQPLGSAGPTPAQVDEGVFVAGDHRHDPSINGALASGVAAARAVAGGPGASSSR